MTKRIVLAGILAGFALFFWEAVAHMATPLGMAGWKAFQDEPAMLGVLKANFQESGLYAYPAPNPAKPAEAGTPTGLLLINRRGSTEMQPAQFATQLGLDVAAMVLAGLVLTQLAPGVGFVVRYSIVLLLAVVPSLRSELPMWNWFGFPKKYVAAQLAINLVGFAVGGLIVAKMVQPKSKAMAAGA